MNTVTTTRIVKLSPEEAAKILREALGLPPTARVNFEFGIRDDQFGIQGCIAVTLQHEEITPIKTKTTTFRSDPSQFEDHDWAQR